MFNWLVKCSRSVEESRFKSQEACKVSSLKRFGKIAKNTLVYQFSFCALPPGLILEENVNENATCEGMRVISNTGRLFVTFSILVVSVISTNTF